MTDIIKSHSRKIETVEDALALYTPTPAHIAGKIGLEVEMGLIKKTTSTPVLPKANEMISIQSMLEEFGFDAQLEASGVLEYASPAVPFSDVGKLIHQVHHELAIFEGAAQEHGFTRVPFCIVPTTTVSDALENKIFRERLDAALKAIPHIYNDEALKTPLLTAGVQASFSPKDMGELFAMTKRGYALTPLLLACMNSFSGFAENEAVRKDFHPRASYYDAHAQAGGIAESFLKSSTSDEFIKNHIDMVFNIPMVFAYNEDGSLLHAEKGKTLTFAKLVEMGLGTQSNFELAESFLYNDIKICNLPNSAGKRVEVRAADSGMHQPASVLLLTAALIPDGPTADKFETLLNQYGFIGHPPTDAPLLIEARRAVVHHKNFFMDVPFGTGLLRDFATNVAALLKEHYAQDMGVQKDLSKLVDILSTGNCDAKVLAKTHPTLKDVCTLLQNAMPPQQRRRLAQGFRPS